MKKGLLHWFIISTFVSLYLIVSIISTIHVIEFFKLSNPYWLSVSLAIAFEIGAAASLASIIVLDKMNKFLVWVLFITLTLMQAMGNTYYAFTNLHDYQSWIELFGLVDEDVIYQKRILSIISGAILPLVALGFIKSLVDYIKPSETSIISEDVKEDIGKAENQGEGFLPEMEESIPSITEDLVDPLKKSETPTNETDEVVSNHVDPIDSNQSEQPPINIEIQHINQKRIEDPVLRYQNSLKNTIN